MWRPSYDDTGRSGHVRSAVFRGPGLPYDIVETALDDPGPGQVRIAVLAAQVCRTDAMQWAGALEAGRPAVFGHSGVAIVEELGPGVTNVAVGERVVVTTTPECGECYWCLNGSTDQCVITHILPFATVGTLPDGSRFEANANLGTYAQATVVPASHLWPTRTALPDDQLALVGCAVVSSVGHVMNVACVTPGSSVAILGMGVTGLISLQAALLAGAQQLVAIDPHPGRRALARRLGATQVLDPSGLDVVEAVRELTQGRGVDFAIECAGPSEAMEQAYDLTRRGGAVTITGMSAANGTVTLPQVPLTVHGKRVEGSQNGKIRISRDLPRAIQLLEDGRIALEPLITGRYSLGDLTEAMERSLGYDDIAGVLVP